MVMTASRLAATPWPVASGVMPSVVIGLVVTLIAPPSVRPHLDQGEARVPPLLRVERADPHQPVHATLRLQPPIGPAAADIEGHRLEAGLLALRLVQDLRPVPVALRPAQVHAQQHLGPI